MYVLAKCQSLTCAMGCFRSPMTENKKLQFSYSKNLALEEIKLIQAHLLFSSSHYMGVGEVIK